jgi:hypothetical protein
MEIVMAFIFRCFAALAVSSSIVSTTVHSAAAATPLANLFTTYSFIGGAEISWITCGSVPQSSGCYSSGFIRRLTNACAIMEGTATVVINNTHQYVVKRPVYVMDAGTPGNVVILNVYIKTDTVTSSNATTTIDYSTRVALPPLIGGKVECFMAGNKTALFTGTSKSPVGAEILTANLQVSQIGGFSPPANVSQITADQRGFVSLQQGTGGNTGFYLFGPDGSLQEDGGGTAFLINNIQSVQLGASAPVSSQPFVVTHPAFHVSQ